LFIVSIDSKCNYRQTTLHFVVLLKNKTIARGLQKERNNQSARYISRFHRTSGNYKQSSRRLKVRLKTCI